MCVHARVSRLSFSWLSWKVNRNFIVLLEGGPVTSFRQEFRRLYLSSQPVPPLFHTAVTLPPSAPGPTQHSPSDSVLRSMLKSQRWVNTGDDSNNAAKNGKIATAAEIPTATDPTLLALSELEVEHGRVETYVRSLAPGQAPTQADGPSQRTRETPQRLGKAEADHVLSDADVSTERRWRTLQAYASTAHASNAPPADPTFCRSYNHGTGVDTAWRVHGPSTLRTHMSPHAEGTAKPTTGAGRLYPDYTRNRRAAMESGTAAVNLDTLRRSQRKEHRAQPGPDADAQPLLRSLSLRAHTQGLFIRTQSLRQWPAAQPSPQNDGCRTQSPKCLVPHPQPHHRRPGAAAKEMLSFRPVTRTDIRSPVNPQLESGFSAAAPKGPQSYPAQQLVPSQRLHWISQLHTRQVVPNVPGVNGTRGQRGVGEPGQRDGQRGVGAGGSGRTSGVLGRPAMLRRGTSFS